MKTIFISGSLRENVGKKDAKMHRRQGLIPCVLYGGKEQCHFSTDVKNFKELVYTPNAYSVKLKIEEKEIDAILKEVQFHPVSDEILHADFLEVTPEKVIVMEIPVKFMGTPTGVTIKGGILIKRMRKLKVRGMLSHIPDEIIIDISNLDIGKSVKVRDVMEKEEKLQLMDYPDSAIVSVTVPRAVVEETKEEVKEEGAAGEEAKDEKKDDKKEEGKKDDPKKEEGKKEGAKKEGTKDKK